MTGGAVVPLNLRKSDTDDYNYQERKNLRHISLIHRDHLGGSWILIPTGIFLLRVCRTGMAAIDGKTSFLGSLSPWSGPRSTTPKSSGGPLANEPEKIEEPPAQPQGGDHTVPHRHRLSLRKYPRDVPHLKVRWFYAVDVPKRKPFAQPSKDVKPPPPKKFVAFSPIDSYSIEAAFQKLAEQEDADQAMAILGQKDETKTNEHNSDVESKRPIKVPVNEDYLFDVNIEERELEPAYWLGPVYDVRRGTWFFQDGSALKPCEENLATQLEEGYLKTKPWRFPGQQLRQPPSQTRTRSSSGPELTSFDRQRENESQSSKASAEKLNPHETKEKDDKFGAAVDSANTPIRQTPHRLFGTYMNSSVTYQDATTAWLLSDDFMSRMSSTVYQRFGAVGGTKLVRGFEEPKKPKDAKDGKNEYSSPNIKKTTDENLLDSSSGSKANRRSAPPGSIASQSEESDTETKERTLEEYRSENLRASLERQVSNLVGETENPEEQAEEVRKRDEKEMEDDYREHYGAEQGREINHLILVTHGIGQRLGLRLESVNFVHDVNVLRKTLKSVYASSPDLQAMNSQDKDAPMNCRVQVLPVLKHNRKEMDLADADFDAEVEEYPSLEDITVEGVPAIRNLISDLALDVLLYQSVYREHIGGIVQRECNHIYKDFKERNPTFKGRVSLVGHSLGSAILFDILCRQKEPPTARPYYYKQYHGSGKSNAQATELKLDFNTEDFFCLGSPVGLFQMLKGQKISGRHTRDAALAESPFEPDNYDDPFLGTGTSRPQSSGGISSSPSAAIASSSPKCRELFNIFHPTDPIGYRMEPLISSAMSSLKPQPLPYTKKGFFGAQGQGISSIGARVGQSVGSLWSNLASGVASSLLNRSLGITGEEHSTVNTPPRIPKAPVAPGAGTNITAGVVSTQEAINEEKKRRLAADKGKARGPSDHLPTLIDDEIETLFSGFQKRRRTQQSEGSQDSGDHAEWEEAEERARRLRREEAKVRALNSNGRVDYSIQE
ncbi:MAG: hypothetical protein M1834_007256 [Cirrosporium novae-zelandiae]|nr:MAG: hypothetical protein M1834_007256 [Cirrosporium novae-zelandiae]